MRPLRVLTLVDRPVEEGGGERVARTIAMRLDPERFDSTLCATRPVDACSLDGLTAAGAQVLCLDRASRTSLASWWPLVTFIRSKRIDVIHTHKFGSNVWGSIIGRMSRVPVVVAHEHSWSYEGDAIRRFLDREVVGRAADVILAVSRPDRQRMIEVEGIGPDRVRYIPNGVSTQRLDERRVVRSELGIPDYAPVIGAVGGLRPEKAFHLLVECASLLVREFPELRALLAGSGPEESRLRALIRSRKLDRVVSLLGYRSDVPEVVAAFDVAVSTSEREGSPLAVMEYMAGGKPVVATCVGGLPDMIADGAEGLLVERGNSQELAAAIGRLLRNPQLRVEMGARARRRQRAEYDINLTVKGIESLYEELFRVSSRGRSERCAPSVFETSW